MIWIGIKNNIMNYYSKNLNFSTNTNFMNTVIIEY